MLLVEYTQYLQRHPWKKVKLHSHPYKFLPASIWVNRASAIINFTSWKYTIGINKTGLRPLQILSGWKYAILYA